MTAKGRWDAAMRLALAEAAVGLAGGDVPVGAVVLRAGGVADYPDPDHPDPDRPDPGGAAPDDRSEDVGLTVVSAAHNEREARQDPTAHAEVIALRRAAAATGSWRLAGLTLVATLEPCPMCAGAVVLSRVRRLVYGAPDPKAGAVGSCWDVVRDPRVNHRPEVIGGVLASESAALLRTFFRDQRGVR